MKALSFCWLVVLLLPSCVLVQPLDDAKPASGGGESGGASSGAGGSSAGALNALGGGGVGVILPGGAGGGVSVDPRALFTGLWVLSSGSLTLICNGKSSTSNVTDISELWAPGTTSDLMQTEEGSDCPLLANINRRVAVGLPNQDCMSSGLDSMGNPYSQDLKISSYTFTVGVGDATAAEKFSGTVAYTDIDTAITSNCTFTQTDNFNKN